MEDHKPTTYEALRDMVFRRVDVNLHSKINTLSYDMVDMFYLKKHDILWFEISSKIHLDPTENEMAMH